MAHTIGFEEERVIKGGYGYGFEIVGAIVIRGAIEICGTDFFEGVDVERLDVFAATEHQVFKEMGEPRFAGLLVFGANVIPDINGHDGSLVVLMHQERKTVIEDELLVRNIDIQLLRECRQSKK